ncbi:MAG: hypothetical protein WBW93_15155 [Steroidobacteraceae bacterium]
MRKGLHRPAAGIALALACAMLAPPAQAAAESGCPRFVAVQGGYAVSAAFSVVGEHHAIIVLPKCLRARDLLSIRPLRLNPDEYLVLQKCKPAACSQAEVVRAWNSSGYMGPYPVLTDKIPVEAGTSYLLWMQHVPIPGTDIFRLIERRGPPLVFKPFGCLTAFPYAQRALQAARKSGPERITNAVRQGGTFVATFQDGSVVRMQALRPR